MRSVGNDLVQVDGSSIGPEGLRVRGDAEMPEMIHSSKNAGFTMVYQVSMAGFTMVFVKFMGQSGAR